MAVTEEARHRLYQRLEEVLGGEATTLMELVPGVGWAEVATKHDLRELGSRLEFQLGQLEERTNLRFESLERRVLGELHRELKMQLIAVIGIVGTGVAVATGLSQLL